MTSSPSRVAPAPVAPSSPSSLLSASSLAVAAMLGARSVAVVGASPRPGSFGARMVAEAARHRPAEGPGSGRRVHLVNPRHTTIDGLPCLPSLAAIGEAVDLVLLGVPDAALVAQLDAAATLGARGAVVFGNAVGEARRGAHGGTSDDSLREQLRAVATAAGMALCGAGCMGFVNVPADLRALGYLERDPLPAGPISLVTHSGSVFSALLRTRRALGWNLAISSGQELVTTTADYLEHILDRTDTAVVALVLETARDGQRLRAQLRRAAERDVPVVLLPVGSSPLGASMVAAHSGALAGDGAMWEALCADTGAMRVADLGEMADTLELLSLVRRPAATGAGTGIATVHDSGAERTLAVDLAHALGVPFAQVGAATLAAIDDQLDAGLVAANPLDLWGTGADTRSLFAGCLQAMVDDPAVAVTALAVDLVSEYDGDTAYADAVLDVVSRPVPAAAQTAPPVVVLANLPSAIDDATAGRLRAGGVPVLEGTRSGLLALKHLLARGTGASDDAPAPGLDVERRHRWASRLREPGPLTGAESFALLADYGVPAVGVRAASTWEQVRAAAADVGYPVALKTEGVAHKSDVGGVRLGLVDAGAAEAAYRDLCERLGPQVLVAAMAPPGVELSLGLVRDASLGPMVVVAAGGVMVELLGDRVVALPPISRARAAAMLGALRIAPLLAGWRGAPPVDLDALVEAVLGVSALAAELGGELAALDVNPVLAGPGGALAVDVLVVAKPARGGRSEDRVDLAHGGVDLPGA